MSLFFQQEDRSVIPNPLESVHLIGICGSGMYPLAQALLEEGVQVSGSDINIDKASPLIDQGAPCYLGHAAVNIGSPSVVVISSAIAQDNPELNAARLKGIPIVHRSVMLGWFLHRRRSILIAGTHGKTSTTAMLGLLMKGCGKQSWCFVGGYVPEFNGNFLSGDSGYAIAEADESDGSFLNLPRDHMILTNIEPEHMNYWRTRGRLFDGFRAMIEGIPDNGILALCRDDPGNQEILGTIGRSFVSWSLTNDSKADYRASDIIYTGDSIEFTFQGSKIDTPIRVHAGVPGEHNVSNLCGSLTMMAELDELDNRAGEALKSFRGVNRRFTKLYAPEGFLVIDDYAHHPTEIAATMRAASRVREERNGRLFVVFQPHRYSRIAELFDAFSTCFEGADELIVMDIYSSGEAPIPGVSSDKLSDKLELEYHFAVQHIPTIPEVEKTLLFRIKSDDIVLLLGAGSVTKLVDLLTQPAHKFTRNES